MKKTLYILAALLLAASCAKESAPVATKAVAFTIGNVSSGTMRTKAVTDLLTATAPSGPFTIKLTSKTNANRRYTITAGETANIILDTYTATCRYTPSVKATGIRAKLFLEPSFYVNTEVTISEETDVVTLPAEYTCIALIQEQSSTSKYTFSSEPGTQTELATQVVSDGYGVTYITCESQWTASYGFSIVAVPVDDTDHESTQYRFITDTQSVSDGQVYVENGKWYIFRPAEADAASGDLGIDFPEWSAGAE